MSKLLDEINEPADLKNLTPAELVALASEIRATIVASLSQTGGHLAANLGVVELTIALHTVFSSPKDKIIWDVGHQCYTHKILTGRRDQLGTLRQFGGLSGFPKRRESPHDAFQTGHSSTSISAALGYAKARDLAGGEHSVVAVIGDGAMTGGLAFEALNNAGEDGTDLIVVLNDNRMAIGPNVGALPAYLSRVRSAPIYDRMKADVELILNKIPVVGRGVARVAERVKDSIKYLVVPGMLFEELGFTYLGPIDGHNIAVLQRVLRNAREIGGPVLVHVLTQKGRGYAPAERNPDKYHGPGPFDVLTGEIYHKEGAPTYSQVFGRTLIRLAEQDERLVAITAAMPDGTGLAEFARRFPDRFFDVGIAEAHAATFAAGLAAGGLRPVYAVYSTFLQRAYDQVIHDICLQGLPVVLAVDRAGLVGDDGETHHGIYDCAFLRTVPGIVVMAPRDENELQHMLKTAISLDGPAVVRYPRGQSQGVTMDPEPRVLPVGRAEVLRRGRDVAIVALGSMVRQAERAAELLAEEGIRTTVVNARYVKPLDGALLEELAATVGMIVTVEEHALAAGFGGAVLEYLAERGHGPVPVLCLGLPDQVIEHGAPSIYLKEYGLTGEGIASAVREFLREQCRGARQHGRP